MEQPPPTRSSHPRLTSPGVLLALAIGLLVLLGLVVAASRAHHTPGGHAGVHQPPSGVGDYLFSIFAVIAVSGGLFLLYLWFSERDLLAENRRRRQGKGMYKALFLLLLILAIAPLLRQRFHILQHRSSQRATVHPGTPNKKKAHTPSGRFAER